MSLPADGLLDSLSDQLASPQEAKLLLALRQELAGDLKAVPAFPELVGDVRLLRTLRGFSHDLAEAAAAFRRHLAVRREQGLDAIRERILAQWGGRLWELRVEDAPHGKLVQSYMPEVLIFTKTKRGDPITLGWWGKGRPADFVREVANWRERFMEYFLFVSEAKSLILDEASRAQQRLVHFTSVFDLQDWSIVGNSHHAWTKFCTEQTAPVGQTYHDVTSYFFAIRTTRLAKVAYGMVKPLLPKKVTRKVFLLGDDFSISDELRSVLDEDAIASVASGSPAPVTQRLREGRVAIKPRAVFELRLELPPKATLRWNFNIEGDQCMRQISGSDLTFSLVNCGTVSFSKGPQRVNGANVRGFLEPAGPHVPAVCMRWENDAALLTSRMLHYCVEVQLAPRQVHLTKSTKPANTLHSLVGLLLGLCTFLLAIIVVKTRN